MLDSLHNSLLSLIYPQECNCCARQVERLDDGVACRDCWSKTRIFTGKEMLCDKCGAFFGDEAAQVPVYCHKCDDHSYDKAAAVGIYENALAATIIHLKRVPILNSRAKRHLSAAINYFGTLNFDLIIPIPLSRQRMFERGFNQAEIIGQEIGRMSGIPVDAFSLARKTHTPIHRVGMDQKARELTVRNAFEIKRPKLIAGKNILLVDDVFTSGATSSYCAKILKKNGAGRVNVFTLARAVMN